MIVVLLVSIAGFVATETSRVLKAAHDFEVLGLPVELASQATIQNAYHRLSRAIHPDHACKWEDAVCTQAATQAMMRINNAREALVDPVEQLDVLERVTEHLYGYLFPGIDLVYERPVVYEWRCTVGQFLLYVHLFLGCPVLFLLLVQCHSFFVGPSRSHRRRKNHTVAVAKITALLGSQRGVSLPMLASPPVPACQPKNMRAARMVRMLAVARAASADAARRSRAYEVPHKGHLLCKLACVMWYIIGAQSIVIGLRQQYLTYGTHISFLGGVLGVK